MTPIIQYVSIGTLPSDKIQAQQLKNIVAQYTLINDKLYHQYYSWLLLKCVTEFEGTYILREVHEDICGSHIGARSLTWKVMHFGNFCPTIETDATILIKHFSKCQLHANAHHLPTIEFHTIRNPIPLYQ